MIRRTTLIAAAAILTACSDPAGPCDSIHACEVTGVDLAIVDARVVEGERIGTDVVTGLPVYAAGPVSVEFTIVNRGDSTSLPQPYGSADDDVIRPLRPGESTQLVLSVDYTDELHFEYLLPGDPLDARAADRRTISLYLQQRPAGPSNFPAEWPVEDADVSNNLHDGSAFHVAMPVLRATMPNVAEIRANNPFVASFRIENVSVHGADAGPFDVVLCTVDFDLSCYGDWWTFFGRFQVPGVAAGWKYENAYVTEMGFSSMVWPYESHSGILVLCIVPSDYEPAYLPWPTGCITGGSAATLFRPDYEACNPPILQPGVSLTIPEPNCNNAHPARSFTVAAFDAVAGHVYTIDGGSVTVYDANGEDAGHGWPGVTFEESGRYYVVYLQTGALTITLSQ